MARKKSHRVKSRRRSHRRAATGFGSHKLRVGVARAQIRSRYMTAKREYHRLGEALYRADHGGRSAHRRRKSKKRGRR